MKTAKSKTVHLIFPALRLTHHRTFVEKVKGKKKYLIMKYHTNL